MALVRSRSAELFQHKTMTSTTRQLQQALYHLLDDLEKSAFIEALSLYRTHRDIFELVNGLRKILNTPVKRQLFPLVRKVIRQEHVEAFDLITKDVKQHNTITLPFLYRPHMADLNVLHKYRAAKTPAEQRNPLVRSWAGTAADKPAGPLSRKSATLQRDSGVSQQDGKHKTMSSRSAASSEDTDAQIVEIDIGEPDSEEEGYGFTIRGGIEVGVGVYVSSVDNGSPAQRKGLTAGDLILEANNISFNNISHEEAARIIKAATRLRVTVSRVGRIPSSHAVHEAYSWTDPKGRPVSPPLDRGGSAPGDGDDERSRSASQMLKASDERKINIVVQKNHGLGILIRGGKEYGLGIFVSGIDPFSVAENAGMKLGDQILDVNGRSFLDITHAEAVNLLQTSRHLIITVKDVGKIPFAKTTIDERGWIESTRVGSYPNSLSLSSRKSVSGSLTDQDAKKKVFSRGVGTQLMLTSSLGKAKQREQIYDQAKLLLNEQEHSTLNYYLSEYEKKSVNIRGMAQALLELLNTPAKLTLMSEIRATVRPADLATFDQLIAKRDLEKSLNQARKLLAPDLISLSSFDSDDVIDGEKFKRTMFSHPKNVLLKSQPMDILDFDDDAERDLDSYNLLETSRRLTRSTPDLTNLDLVHTSQQQTTTRSRSRSPWSVYPSYQKSKPKAAIRNVDSRSTIVNFAQDLTKTKIDYPSDDSGVEINGHPRMGLPPGSYPGIPEHTFVYNNSPREHTSWEVNPNEMSGPQKKILSHLQLRKAQEVQHNIFNKNSRNHNTETKMTSKPSSAENKGFINRIDHTAEVHKSPVSSDDENTRDLPDLYVQDPKRSPSEDPSRNDADIRPTLNGTGRRPPHRSRLKDKFRTRSRSKSRGNEDFDDVNERESTQRATHSSTVGLVHGDTSASHDNFTLYRNEEHVDATSKQSSVVFNVPLKPRPRKDKSPFKQIWRNFKHNGNSSSAYRNQGGDLTINGQIVSSPTPDSDESSTLINQNHTQVEQRSDNDELNILESHDDHMPDIDISDSQIGGNTVVSKPSTANHKSKGAVLARARKSLSNENSPTKVGGVSSSRYKSPRRDKQVSRINVPLIKVDNSSNDNPGVVPLATPLSRNVGDNKDGGSFLTVIQYNGNIKDEQKSRARIPISDQVADPAARALSRDSATTGRGSSANQGRNVTSISVGTMSTQGPSAQPMDDNITDQHLSSA